MIKADARRGEIADYGVAIMVASTKRVLLADHSKFDQVALQVFGDPTSFDAALVTDGIGDGDARKLERAGVNVRIVKTETP